MTLLARPLSRVRSFAAVACTALASSTRTREATNPVITIPSGETSEQYVPAPIRVANGDIWVYAKGTSRIYAYKSTDDGATFTIQNGGAAVLAPVAATWEADFVLEPAAVYDGATDTIHLYYKGRDANPANWQWGHATAPGATPTVFTRDGANPIFTKANALADLGKVSVEDFAISDVLVVGSTYHYFGYGSWNGRYQLVHATGTTWNNPSGLTSLLLAENDSRVVECPSVFSFRTLWEMLYSRGDPQTVVGGLWTGARDVEAASSSGGLSSWDFSDTTAIVSPTGSGWEQVETFAGSMLKNKAGVPIAIGGKWLYFYSGLSTAGHATVGLMRIDNPCGGDDEDGGGDGGGGGGGGTPAGLYIAPSGNDSTGDGSFALPWATLAHALAAAGPDTTIWCRGGTYTGSGNRNITFTASGTAGHPITIAAYATETPIFNGQANGTSDDDRYWLNANGDYSHVVVDGIKLINFSMTQDGVITLSNQNSGETISDWTIRNCDFQQVAPADPSAQMIYLGERVDGFLLEDSILRGPHPSGLVNGGAGVSAYADSGPDPINVVIRRTIFIGWYNGGVQFYSEGVTGEITHCTFIDCRDNIDATHHSTILVRDNAGETGSDANFYDPDPTGTTADHNFWGQSFNPDYSLVGGSTGLNAASDGSDAGAVQS